MLKRLAIASLVPFIISQLFVIAIDSASGSSNSTPYPEPIQSITSSSSFEDPLVYPKHAISPYHIDEQASASFAKPVSRKIAKFKLKVGKTQADQGRKDSSDQRKRKRDPRYESDGRSPNTPHKRRFHTNEKSEKAMNNLKQFSKNFKNPEERLQKQKDIYTNPYKSKRENKEHSEEFARRLRAKQMTRERLLHQSTLHIKPDSRNHQ